MIKEFFKKYWIHILLWIGMITYFFLAPDFFTFAFIKNGKPIRKDNAIPTELDRIVFVVEDFESYVKDKENLFNLTGWAFISPEENELAESYTREIVLVSDERKYFFPVKSIYRNPALPSKFANVEINLDSLGFIALISEDVIKPGKYRVGIVFRNTVDGSAFYWDKPASYIVRTPNTINLQK